MRLYDLSVPQQGWLLLIDSTPRPGLSKPSGHPVPRALERRGYVTSREDPTAPGNSLWTVTAAGRELIARRQDEPA